jgi:hypothetical protein
MAKIIQFPPRAELDDEAPDIDLLTAIDAAIRDLRDIAAVCSEEAARRQAEDCRRMLERAYESAI